MGNQGVINSESIERKLHEAYETARALEDFIVSFIKKNPKSTEETIEKAVRERFPKLKCYDIKDLLERMVAEGILYSRKTTVYSYNSE